MPIREKACARDPRTASRPPPTRSARFRASKRFTDDRVDGRRAIFTVSELRARASRGIALTEERVLEILEPANFIGRSDARSDKPNDAVYL